MGHLDGKKNRGGNFSSGIPQMELGIISGEENSRWWGRVQIDNPCPEDPSIPFGEKTGGKNLRRSGAPFGLPLLLALIIDTPN